MVSYSRVSFFLRTGFVSRPEIILVLIVQPCNVMLRKTLIGVVAMVTMVQSAANWRNTHTHTGRTHLLTHFTSTQLQPRDAKRQLSYNLFSACWVFSCFRNPPNSEMEYGIFNVRTCSFMCCAYTHGGWAHRQRVSTICLTRKNSQLFSCAPDGIRTIVLWTLSPTLYQLSHPVPRNHLLFVQPCNHFRSCPALQSL